MCGLAGGVRMRRIESAEEWDAILRGGVGCAYSDYPNARQAAAGQGSTLHAAGGTTLRSSRFRARPFPPPPKYHGEDCPQAVPWLERERGTEGTPWRRCRRC